MPLIYRWETSWALALRIGYPHSLIHSVVIAELPKREIGINWLILLHRRLIWEV